MLLSQNNIVIPSLRKGSEMKIKKDLILTHSLPHLFTLSLWEAKFIEYSYKWDDYYNHRKLCDLLGMGLEKLSQKQWFDLIKQTRKSQISWWVRMKMILVLLDRTKLIFWLITKKASEDQFCLDIYWKTDRYFFKIRKFLIHFFSHFT